MTINGSVRDTGIILTNSTTLEFITAAASSVANLCVHTKISNHVPIIITHILTYTESANEDYLGEPQRHSVSPCFQITHYFKIVFSEVGVIQKTVQEQYIGHQECVRKSTYNITVMCLVPA